MDKINNNKVIDYIDGAKDWLEEAKTEYTKANPVGGELKLNMAQAEIKYAWELSRSNYVSNTIKRMPDHRFKLLLPAAASLIILSGLGLWLGTGGFHMAKKVPSVTENYQPVLNKHIAFNGASQNPVVTKTSNSIPSNIALNKTVVENELKPTKTDSKPVVNSDEPARNSDQIGNTVLASQTRIKENPVIQPNLQPVSKLAIDEEALTKEASHSLRNGK